MFASSRATITSFQFPDFDFRSAMAGPCSVVEGRKITPAFSRAFRTLSTASNATPFPPASILTIVWRPTPARSASCSWLSSTNARATRILIKYEMTSYALALGEETR